MTARESQILCGLFLSKYNEQALGALGFESFAAAYNVLGSALTVSPATIKNYRDELDPHFPNRRRGWHQRPLRLHCKAVLEKYGELSLPELATLVKTLFDPAADLFETEPEQEYADGTGQTSFAKRLITGRAAEGFFRANYGRHEQWRGGNLVDTTSTGCGFDFRINFAETASFHAVEVKGLFDSRGNIMLTEKKHRRADQFRDRYFLYVVRNFKEIPVASIWRDPLNSDLKWDLVSQQQVIKSWRTGL
jgi:Domain of unknown function (DUF3883)